MEKLCTGCNRVLPVTSEYFHKKKGTRDGHCSRCKECISNYHAKYFHDKHEEVLERKRQHGASYYKRNKERVQERRRQNYASGGTRKTYMDRYYVENKPIIIKYRKAYVKTAGGKLVQKLHQERRRALGKSVPINFNLEEWESCKLHFEHTCCYCGNGEILTRDHFIPLVKGGEYTINNIVPACKPCNSKKKQNDFFIWYPKQPFFSKDREQKILRYLNYNENKVQQLALL